MTRRDPRGVDPSGLTLTSALSARMLGDAAVLDRGEDFVFLPAGRSTTNQRERVDQYSQLKRTKWPLSRRTDRRTDQKLSALGEGCSSGPDHVRRGAAVLRKRLTIRGSGNCVQGSHRTMLNVTGQYIAAPEIGLPMKRTASWGDGVARHRDGGRLSVVGAAEGAAAGVGAAGTAPLAAHAGHRARPPPDQCASAVVRCRCAALSLKFVPET